MYLFEIPYEFINAPHDFLKIAHEFIDPLVIPHNTMDIVWVYLHQRLTPESFKWKSLRNPPYHCSYSGPRPTHLTTPTSPTQANPPQAVAVIGINYFRAGSCSCNGN